MRNPFKYVINFFRYEKLKKKWSIRTYDTFDTLKLLIETECSISRFGDGEIAQIHGVSETFQTCSPLLKTRLEEILKYENPVDNHVVAIPYIWTSYKGYTYKSIWYWSKFCVDNYKYLKKTLNKNYPYYDSQVTRIYINRKDKKSCKKYFNLWKEFWREKDLLIVEGEKSRFGVGNDLLHNTKSVKRILCPAEGAFEYYQEIFDAIKSELSNKNCTVMILLGPTATILAYDLAKDGIRAIDIGNLDMEYEWCNMGTKKQEKVKGKYTYEVSGNSPGVIDDINDETYYEQIVRRIGC